MKKIIATIVLLGLAIFLISVTLLNNSNHEDTISNSKKGDPTEVYVSDAMSFEQIQREMHFESEELKNGAPRDFLMSAEDNNIDPKSTYRVISGKIKVNDDFYPMVNVYCETDEHEKNTKTIKKIIGTTIDHKYNDDIKQFSGSIFVHQVNDNKIFLIVNGDYYNDGGSYNYEVTRNEEKMKNISYMIDYPNQHYAYVYKERYLEFH